MKTQTVEARVEGDWISCGVTGCGTRFALGLAAVRLGARMKCPRCGTWQNVPVKGAAE